MKLATKERQNRILTETEQKTVVWTLCVIIFLASMNLPAVTAVKEGLLRHVICVTLHTATALASYYAFRFIFEDYRIGLLCSALQTLSLYRIYRITYENDLRESAVFVFLPLILAGLYGIYTASDTKSKEAARARTLFALGFMGTLVADLVVFGITMTAIVVVCLVLCRSTFRKETFGSLIRVAVKSVVFSIWYLIPLGIYWVRENEVIRSTPRTLIQKHGIQPAQLAIHFMQPMSSLKDADGGMQNTKPVGIGLILMLAAVLFLIQWFAGKWKKDAPKPAVCGKVLVCTGLVACALSTKVFPWDALSGAHTALAFIISCIDWAPNFLGVATVCLVGAAGACLWQWKQEQNKWLWYTGVVSVILSVATSSLYLYDGLTKL